MAESAAHAPWMLRSADAPSPRQEYVMDQVFCRWFKTSWAWDRREDGDETVLELEGVELGRWLDHPLVTSEVRPQDDHQVEWTAWQHGEVTLRVPCAVEAEGNGWPFDPWRRRFTRSHVGRNKQAGWLWMNMAVLGAFLTLGGLCRESFKD